MTDTVLSVEEIRDRIGRLPRLRLAVLPTPLQSCSRLSAEVGVDVWVKRDDLTGLAFAAMLDHTATGRVRRGESIVFLHTGGQPALFAYDKEVLGIEA